MPKKKKHSSEIGFELWRDYKDAYKDANELYLTIAQQHGPAAAKKIFNHVGRDRTPTKTTI